MSAAENSKNYKTRNEITGEISELKTKQCELESDLKELQKKDMRARKYQVSHNKSQSSTPVSPFHQMRIKPKRLTLEGGSPATLSNYDPSTCTIDLNSDGYHVDYSASRSTTSSPSHARNDPEFTAKEFKRFSVRCEKGYNISDDRYQALLTVNHPESASAAAVAWITTHSSGLVSHMYRDSTIIISLSK